MPNNRPSPLEQNIAAVRRFNRFYTRRIGLLNEGHLQSAYSLTALRVLYEIATGERPSATDIARALNLDHGYLSRVLRAFSERGLITRTPGAGDRRRSTLALTAAGRRLFATIDRRSNAQVGAMIGPLSAGQQERLIAAMRTIEALIEPPPQPALPYILRPPRAGDMGWVVARHGVIYGREFGWDQRIEALTAEIVAAFVKNFDPARERCWIAERDGENVGSVFVVKDKPGVARLRLLMVEPSARGLGIGQKLVDECVAFARDAGYRKMTLWTHAVLVAARRIYENAGFKLRRTWRHDDFGPMLTAETWDLKL